jgi:hypothetical protein
MKPSRAWANCGARQPVVDVRRLPEARGVPGEDGVITREVGEHPPPRAAVGRCTVQQDKRWTRARNAVGDPDPVDFDVFHAGILSQNRQQRRGAMRIRPGSGYASCITNQHDIDGDRLALIVLDSIDRQVAKFDDPVMGNEVRAHLEGHLEAGRVEIIEPDDSDYVNVIVGETWLARVHWQRIRKRADPRFN